MSGRTYEDGRINGIRFAVTWLHERANEMNDPHAKALYNSAAFGLGAEINTIRKPPGTETETKWPGHILPDFPSGNGETDMG